MTFVSLHWRRKELVVPKKFERKLLMLNQTDKYFKVICLCALLIIKWHLKITDKETKKGKADISPLQGPPLFSSTKKGSE